MKKALILGIESSCDDTAAAIISGRKILSNITNTQLIHASHGGVVPELAGRAHMENMVRIVDMALDKAQIQLNDLDAIAFTVGPGLQVSLVVGTSFAKGLALALHKPMIAVHHMKAHILSHFIEEEGMVAPSFPYLCLTVSGGHTQLVVVHSALEMEIIGKTIDDAAGEAFDKTAKMLGFSYPGGPLIDAHSKNGNPHAFLFSKPKIKGLDFSFSGLKTSVLYTLQAATKENPDFIAQNRNDLCASIQESISSILMDKLKKAQQATGIKHIAVSGGVSVNSGLRKKLFAWQEAQPDISVHLAHPKYCTDNGAMVAITGSLYFDEGSFADQSVAAEARLQW